MGPERTIRIYTLAQTYHVKLQDLVADFQPQERTSISLLFHLHCHLREILTFQINHKAQLCNDCVNMKLTFSPYVL